MASRKEIGERIKAAREARGWSQERLAAESNVAPNTITGVETGVRRPQAATRRRIMDALGMAELEEDATLDLAGVPDDVRTFLRAVVRRMPAVDEAARARMLNDLYARMIIEEPREDRLVREAREAREAELVDGSTSDTPKGEGGVASSRRAR